MSGTRDGAEFDEAVRRRTANDFEGALGILQTLLASDSGWTEALVEAGLCLAGLDLHADALATLAQATILAPGNVQAHDQLGLQQRKLGDRPGALASSERVVSLDPGFANGWYRRGNLLVELGELEQALLHYDRAMACEPRFAVFHFNREVVLRKLAACRTWGVDSENRPQPGQLVPDLQAHSPAMGQKDGAEWTAAVGSQPMLPKSDRLLGRTLDAIAAYDVALAHNPNHADAHFNRANLCWELKRTDEAVAGFRIALVLKPALQCGNVIDRGQELAFAGMREEAELAFDLAASVSGDNAPMMVQVAWGYHQAGYNTQALVAIERAIALEPGRLAYLASRAGIYRDPGQQEPRAKFRLRGFDQPCWLGGEPVAGKTVLVNPEQGFGDFIQRCRYAPMLRALGARVVLESPRALFSLSETLDGPQAVVEMGAPLPAFDYYIPVMSLPFALRTTLDTIPARSAYLSVPAAHATRWAGRLGPGNGLRVGLVWSGSTTHRGDHGRSLQLEHLRPLLASGLEFHCLQKEIRASDEPLLDTWPTVHRHDDALEDFADTAALAQAMDLVISVDTAVAHLAGALGRPVWVLLPLVPDWRWLLDRPDSPWYPTARLFRQATRGDWPGLVADLAAALAQWAAGARST